VTKLGHYIHDHGVNVELFAKAAGISRARMYRFMSGASVPNVKEALRICKMLREDIHDFWSDGDVYLGEKPRPYK